MKFNRQQLYDLIEINTLQATSVIITKLLQSIKQYTDLNGCSDYLMDLLEEITKIMSRDSYSPSFKLKATLVKIHPMQMIMFLISVDNPEVYIAFQQTVYPIIVQIVEEKNQLSFKKSINSKNTIIDQKTELKKINQLIKRFSLQTVIVLAYWIPYALDDTQNTSQFKKRYQQLCSKGIKFPDENQLIFYTYEKLHEIQLKKIKILQQLNLMEKSLNKSQSNQFSGSFRAKNSTYLFQKAILEHKSQSPVSKSASQNLREKRISMKSLKSIKQTNSKMASNSRQSQEDYPTKYQSQINKLQAQNDQLKTQIVNLKALLEQKDKFIIKYRHQINRLTKMLNTQSQPFSFFEINNTNEKSFSLGKNGKNHLGKIKQLKQGILKQCTQPSQFKSSSDLLKVHQFPFRKSELSEKQRPSLFPFYYSLLSRQNKIRLKKALLKDKQLLEKNSEIQIGIISKFVSDDQMCFCLVLTNISDTNFSNFLFEWAYDKRSFIVEQLSQVKSFILSGQQHQLQFKIKCISSKYLDGVLVKIAYSLQGKSSDAKKYALLLPMRPLKFMRSIVMSSIPMYENPIKVQRVIKKNRRILSDFTKIKKYWNECIEDKKVYLKNTLPSYKLKLRYLSNSFYVNFYQMIQDKMLIEVVSHQDQLSKAQTVLEELVFVFEEK